MADNVVANAGSGGSTFATDDVGGVQYPRSKQVWGVDGTATDVSATNPLPVQGGAAQGSSVNGNPVLQGLRAGTADFTAVADAQAAAMLGTILGKIVTMPHALPANFWSYAAPTAGLVATSGVTVKAAGAGAVRNYITAVQVINSHPTIDTEVAIKDGAGGTVLHRGWAGAGNGGYTCVFDPPLRGTAATLVEIAESVQTATTGVYVNVQGYSAAE